MFLYIYIVNVFFYQVKMLMFYSMQTTNSIMVGKKNEMHNRQLYHCMILNRKSH